MKRETRSRGSRGSVPAVERVDPPAELVAEVSVPVARSRGHCGRADDEARPLRNVRVA